MLDRIKEIFESIPKPVIIAFVILAIIGGLWAWKKFSSKDKESEVMKGVQSSQVYAQNIQKGLDSESEPMMSAVTPQYAAEVQTGLGDLETTKQPEAVEDSDDDDFDAFDEE